MTRLTDRRTAAELKKNVEGLRAAGIEPSEMDLRYIKLAEYENADEEIKNAVLFNDSGKGYHRITAANAFFEKRFLETSEDDTRQLKCNPVTKQSRTPILTVDEIHKDPQTVKEVFEFFGLDEFISKRFTETR